MAHSIAGSDSASVYDNESDKLSVLSETDSGVVVVSSRPNSFLGGILGGLLTPISSQGSVGGPQQATYRGILTPPPNGAFALICAACHKPAYFADSQGPNFLPKNTALANVVQRYLKNGAKSPGKTMLQCKNLERF